MTSKPCQWPGCNDHAIKGERYCFPHRCRKLAEMEREGYLTPLPPEVESVTPGPFAPRDWDDSTAREQGHL